MRLPYPFPDYEEPIDRDYAGAIVTSVATSYLLAAIKVILWS